MRTAKFVILVASLIFSSNLFSATVTITNITDDTFLDTSNPSYVYGNEGTLLVSTKSVLCVPLIKFNISAIQGWTISNATLKIYCNYHVSGENVTFGIGKVSGYDWSEDTLTWSNHHNSFGWVPPETLLINNCWQWYSIPVTSIVQDWVNGTSPNYGFCFWHILGKTAGFVSKEGTDGYSAQLVVTGTSPTITLTSPNGQEDWQRGTTHNITWTGSSGIRKVKIELYENACQNMVITDSTVNDGSYSWLIPSGQNPSYAYQMTIYSVDNSSILDWTDDYFTISAPVPDIAVNPSSWDYGSITWPNYSDKTFGVSNIGNIDLHISNTSIIGTNTDHFSIQSGGGSFTLSPNTTKDIVVRFRAPTSTSSGLKSAILRINSDDPDENPLDASLSANAITVEELKIIPKAFYLLPSSPNPVRSMTAISFGVPKDTYIVIRIYTLTGEEVCTLINSIIQAGQHTVNWNSKTNNGNKVSPGIYFCRMEAGSFKTTQKLTVLR